MTNMTKEIKISDFGKICRICLKENFKRIPLFNSSVLSSLSQFTNINVKINDGLPQEICGNCVDETHRCVRFKQLCENSEQCLRQILNENVDNKNWYETEIPLNQIDNNVKTELPNDNDIKDDFDENFYPDDNSDNDSEKQVDIDKKDKTISVRQARITWVMSLEAEKCDTSKFLCKLCDKRLVNLNSLARHMKMHDENRKFVAECDICNKGFYENSNYLKHMRTHNKNTKYKCKECTKEFFELNLLTRHLRKVHAIKPIECTECNKKFTLQEQYDLHMKIHKKDYEFFCKYCNKGYFLERKLNEHIKSHVSDQYRNFTCEYCNKSYQHNQSLKKHIERHHTNVQQKFNCHLCGSTVFNLKEHYLCKHSTNKPFKCTGCPRSFATELLLRCHTKITHQKLYASKKALCNICGLKTFSKCHLQIHMRTHGDDKPFQCTQCDKSFKTPVGLRAHRTTHKDERPYQCDRCDKAFKQSKALKRHLIIHTGERPFKCNVCDKRFNDKSILNRHMNVHSIHSPNAQGEDVVIQSKT